MSSLKLSASPLIDRATSSSSVHVMRSAEGLSGRTVTVRSLVPRTVRRPPAKDSRDGWGVRLIIVCRAVTSDNGGTYVRRSPAAPAAGLVGHRPYRVQFR